MVLESWISPFKAEKQPWELFFIGFAYTSIALFLSIWIFEEHASLVTVFLTVLATVPLIHTTLLWEEKKDLSLTFERQRLWEHGKAISFMMFLFLGIALAIAFWYVVLPAPMVNSIFTVQSQTISGLNQQVTGGIASQLTLFTHILLNNVKVLIFAILFSFLYGAGVMFILVWNASVIGVATGNFIRTNVISQLAAVGGGPVGTYVQVASLSIVRYMTHGVFEILAYFIAALAGGIISAAIIRHDFTSKRFGKVLYDVSDLLVIAVLILVFAAVVEVYVTPLFF